VCYNRDVPTYRASIQRPGTVRSLLCTRNEVTVLLYDSTKTLLRSILQSLETPDQAEWDDQIESGNQCLYEMHQMTRPSYRAYKTTSSDTWPSHVPDSAKLNRAIPHVKAMMSAIRRRDHATAVESGRKALGEMNGTSPSLLSSRSAEPKTQSKEVFNVVRQHEKPTGKHRPVVEDRRSSRRSRVASSN
jgi:hypothetical protein